MSTNYSRCSKNRVLLKFISYKALGISLVFEGRLKDDRACKLARLLHKTALINWHFWNFEALLGDL